MGEGRGSDSTICWGRTTFVDVGMHGRTHEASVTCRDSFPYEWVHGGPWANPFVPQTNPFIPQTNAPCTQSFVLQTDFVISHAHPVISQTNPLVFKAVGICYKTCHALPVLH